MTMAERWHIQEGWGVLLLPLSLALVIGFGIASAGWTQGLTVIPIASLGAFVIGLMISKSLLPGWLAHGFSLVIGFAGSFWLAARLFPDYWTWPYRWAWLWWFIYQWIIALFTGGVSHNNMIFVLQMALIVWEITFLSLWFIFRTRHVWLAIVPGGVLLLVNVYYSPKDITVYLLVYLVLAFLLVIRFNLFTQEQVWRRERVHFNADEINFDFLRAGAVFTLVILLAAWIAPSLATAQETQLFDTLRGPWHDLQNEWNRLFASLNYRPSAGVDFSSRELTLGGARELSELPVLEIKAPSNARYWRAVVFDKFNGRNWENTNDTLVAFGADSQILPMIDYHARQVVTQTISVLGPTMFMLPMAAQPLWVDRPTRASLSFVDIPTVPGANQLDASGTELGVDTIASVRSRVPLDAGDSYVATSLLTQATERQLRQAGAYYPKWISERYLQLPESVPGRVKQLAEQLAAPYDNPYDKTGAIESFLRREITYNEKIDEPPPDRDPVDYILFDLKQGYCDYYATSMVVMLRSVGIPSRIVSGYAQGAYDPDREAFVVLLQDAHSWVEAYFPRYGWVEFEPTAAQPAIKRVVDSQGTNPLGGDSNPNLEEANLGLMDRKEQLLDEELPRGLDGTTPSPWLNLGPAKPGTWVLGSLVLIILAALTVWAMRNRRAVALSDVAAIYHNMLRLANWAGASIFPWQTPYEHASALSQVLPDGERPARRIAGLYTRERYGRQLPDDREQALVHRAWQELRPKLVRRTILHQVVGRGGLSRIWGKKT